MARPQGPFYKQLGERIAAARAKRPKLTQAKLASVVGISRTSMVNIEAGRQPVYIHHLVQIADTLEVTVTDLMPQASLVLVGANPHIDKLKDLEKRAFAELILGPRTEP